MSLKALLVRAYGVKPYQISGPGWMEFERYDVLAKVPPGTDSGRLRLMLQKLLTERFQIILHRETKEIPVYTLSVAKNGPNLKPAEAPKEYQDDAEREAAVKEETTARLAEMIRKNDFERKRSLNLPSATVSKFAEILSNHLARPVKDLTGLDGLHSFTLSRVPDRVQRRGGGIPEDAPSGPSIFAAVQEQLGLKLDTGKGPIEVLVIDKAEKTPISN